MSHSGLLPSGAPRADVIVSVKRPQKIIAVLVATLLWAGLWVFRLQWSSAEESLWITLLYTLCVLPTILFLFGHKLRSPFMPIWGLGYFLLFGMPMLSDDQQAVLGFMSQAPVVSALQLVVLGAVSCLIAFYTPLGKWAEAMAPRLKAGWDPQLAPRRGILLAMTGIAIHYHNLTSPPSASWEQLLFIGSKLSIVGILTLFLLQLRGMLSWKLKFLLWGFLIPVEYLMGLGTGAIYNALIILAPLLFCYSTERLKIPFVPILISLLICFVPFSGFKGEFRSYAWYGEQGDILVTSSPIQRGLAFINLVVKRLTEGGVEAYTAAAESAEARVSHLDVLIAVMEATPSSIPFWNGYTYQNFFWSVVPRAFFPNKPEKTLGQDFGQRYGLLGSEDVTTSYNLPHQVVEMYINFGVMGVIAGMVLVGFLYRFLVATFSHPEAGERALIVGYTLMASLLTLDGDASLVFGGLFYFSIILYLATRSFGKRAEATAQTS